MSLGLSDAEATALLEAEVICFCDTCKLDGQFHLLDPLYDSISSKIFNEFDRLLEYVDRIVTLKGECFILKSCKNKNGFYLHLEYL